MSKKTGYDGKVAVAPQGRPDAMRSSQKFDLNTAKPRLPGGLPTKCGCGGEFRDKEFPTATGSELWWACPRCGSKRAIRELTIK